MEGIVQLTEDRIIRWSKEGNTWTIQLIKDEENPDSDGHTDLRVETILSTQQHIDQD